MERFEVVMTSEKSLHRYSVWDGPDRAAAERVYETFKGFIRNGHSVYDQVAIIDHGPRSVLESAKAIHDYVEGLCKK